MAASDSYQPGVGFSSRADGGAAFLAAALALAVVAIPALDRVGAPAGLVRALGPIITLVATAAAGIAAVNADLPSFLAAGRSVRAFHGALALTALALGVLLVIDRIPNPVDRPLVDVAAAGLAAGALLVGPLLSRWGASWRSDLLASRYPFWPIRLIAGLCVMVAGLLTAIAGLQSAVDVVNALVLGNRIQAEAIVAATLFLCVAPGGAAGLVASSSTAGGALIIMTTTVIALEGGLDLPPFGFGAGQSFATLTAVVLAAGGFFALDRPALAARDWRTASRAAVGAILLCLALAALLFAIRPQPSAIVSENARDSLVGGAKLAAFLALGAAGGLGVGRAFGIAGAPRRPFAPLASVRLARMRGGMLAALAAAAFIDTRGLIEPSAALVAAMAVSLASTVPLLALALLPRSGSFAAGATLAASAVVVGLYGQAWLHPADAATLLPAALAAGCAGLATGALVALAAPRRRQADRSSARASS